MKKDSKLSLNGFSGTLSRKNTPKRAALIVDQVREWDNENEVLVEVGDITLIVPKESVVFME